MHSSANIITRSNIRHISTAIILISGIIVIIT